MRSKYIIGALVALLALSTMLVNIQDAEAKRRRPKLRTFVYQTAGTDGDRVMVLVLPKGGQPTQIFTAFVGPSADGKEFRVDLPIGRKIETRWSSDGSPATTTMTVSDDGVSGPVTVTIPPKGTITDPTPEPSQDMAEINLRYIGDGVEPTTKIVVTRVRGAEFSKTFNRVMNPGDVFTFNVPPGLYRVRVFDAFGEYYDTAGEADVTWNANKTYSFPPPFASATVYGYFVDNPDVQTSGTLSLKFVPLDVPGAPDTPVMEIGTNGGVQNAFRASLIPGRYRVDAYDSRTEAFSSSEMMFASGEQTIALDR